MPLYILLILVVGGIAGIALALHLLGLSQAEPLTEQSARGAWLRQFPEDAPADIVVAANGRVARIDTRTGRGIVWQMGADTTARYIDNVTCVAQDWGIDIRTSDFTAPRVRLELNQSERAAWQDWMVAS